MPPGSFFFFQNQKHNGLSTGKFDAFLHIKWAFLCFVSDGGLKNDFYASHGNLYLHKTHAYKIKVLLKYLFFGVMIHKRMELYFWIK